MPEPDPDLLDAFRRVLRQHGHAGATMERIAQAAGRSRVTLHRQGITKDTLLSALTDTAIARYRLLLWPVLTGSGSSAQRLELALHALCAAAEGELELLVALQAQSDAVFHEQVDGAQLTRSIFTEPLERLLRDGASDGTVATADHAETATVLFNMVGWTYVHLRAGHGWSAERAAGATVDIALRGVLRS